MVARLILRAATMGYDVTLGDAYRDERCAYGYAKSLHRKRLAVDLNLFWRGVYLERGEQYQTLGEWWESIGGTWGGRFEDGNHFSLEHEGMK